MIITDTNIYIDMRTTVQEVFVKANHNKQVLMFTATLNDKMKEICLKFMKEVL